jgi:hypothetical protein
MMIVRCIVEREPPMRLKDLRFVTSLCFRMLSSLGKH